MLIFGLIITMIYCLYLYGRRNNKYWESKGIKHDKPIPLFGNNARNFLMHASVTQVANEYYWKYPNEKVVGFYRASRPELIVRDPELVKQILITDFNYFYRRNMNNRNGHIEPMLRNLFFADGDVWRLLRQRMNPAFSIAKVRSVFPLITKFVEKLQARIIDVGSEGNVVDARDLMTHYTADVIGSWAFGLKCASLENTATKIYSAIYKKGPKDFLFVTLKQLFPSLFTNLKELARVEKQTIHLVNEIEKQRKSDTCKRNNMIDLLLQCKKESKILGQSIERKQKDEEPEITSLDIDDELIAAQVFFMFSAGVQTSSTAMSITLHELAYNPRVQLKVQTEIDTVLAKYNNKLSYAVIKEMTYIEWTLKEGMRIFPPLGYLVRGCARKYTFEDINLTIDEGVRVLIPLQAIHNDPKYFDSPSEFRPERFDPKNFDAGNKYVYMPFGDGPRACIGKHLGMMQSLAGLAAVLSRFSVRPAPTSVRRPVVAPSSSSLQILNGGLPLIFTQRKCH